MKIKLLIITLTSALCLSLTSCKNDVEAPPDPTDTELTEVASISDTLLSESADRGRDYIDSFIFIGESTTYHMKSRGVLSGGVETKQVWAPRGGTMTLDLSADKIKIVYPETGEELTFFEAAAKKRPEHVLMTFGLNGAVQNIKQGETYFKTAYKKLINAVRTASPETKIILGAAFPVAENMDMSAYSVSAKTLNEYIDTINKWTLSLAAEEGLRYLDTAEIMKNENNSLKKDYDAGDGYHLTKEAYEAILYYIRTHAYN